MSQYLSIPSSTALSSPVIQTNLFLPPSIFPPNFTLLRSPLYSSYISHSVRHRFFLHASNNYSLQRRHHDHQRDGFNSVRPICCCGQVENLKPRRSFTMAENEFALNSTNSSRMYCLSSSSSSSYPSPSSTNGKDDPFKDDSGSESEIEDEEESLSKEGRPVVERWDVLGLGQAMVDFSGVVDDDFLGRLGLEKGTRKVVNHEDRGKVLRAMDGCSYKAAAGGSLSNSLVALARLGSRPIEGPILNVAMAGSIGSDPLGGFYRSKLHRAGVDFHSAPVKDGTTGTVIVLTTPDAQRTMLAYQGTSSKVSYDSGLSSIVSKTNILVVEGYLFELPDTIKSVAKACQDARRSGALVAVTASDVSCIERHYDDFWEIIGNYADIVFANSDEARALCHFSPKERPASATRYLSHFVPMISVTDGPSGSYIGVKGEAVYIPPSPCLPVDTCGAGDAYASGILYGILRGVSDLKDMGAFAAKVAAIVVGQQGTRLRVNDAVELADSSSMISRSRSHG